MFNWVNQFDLFLLDFDGLLVNTEKLHFDCYKKAVESLGFPFTISFETYCQGAHISQDALKQLIYSQTNQLMDAYPDFQIIRRSKQNFYLNTIEKGGLELMPGVEPFLNRIFDLKKQTCIVTNSPQEQIIAVQKKIPILQKIDHLVAREHYSRAKPSGDCYRLSVSLYAQEKDRIIGFEDSQKGVEALLDAKILSVQINPFIETSIANHHFHDFFSVNFASG